ncbi:hypothetical protein Ahy_B06g085209 [Arachis hypogaea]|uniref:Uncharacterized protein n=1 Tax=Arachis hypogaea TaxID=3818 RepID=A0A444YTT2_ARAHY|nr:hypothetical protein Ahy_B06g085209 [Arachis hypogaea]
MGLGFYMRRKLLNVHISDLAHLAKRVRQVEILKKEKEKYKSDEKKLKRPPCVCFLLRKILNSDKSSDSKHKSGKKYSFDISKSDQIFDVLLKDKQLVLPEGRTMLLVTFE